MTQEPSVQDTQELAGWPARIWADEEREWWTDDHRGHMGPFVEYVRADLASPTSEALRAAWMEGRKGYTPAAIFQDAARMEREWQSSKTFAAAPPPATSSAMEALRVTDEMLLQAEAAWDAEVKAGQHFKTRLRAALEAALQAGTGVAVKAPPGMVLVPRELTPLQKLPGVSAYVKVAGECRPVALAAAWTAICDEFASAAPALGESLP